MLWPWQIPGSPVFNVDDAYHLAYLNPAAARATGHDGLVAYLFAAYVRGLTSA